MRHVIVGAAVLLFWLIVFAVAKGVLDKHAQEKCRMDGGTWRCGAVTWAHITVVGCDCQPPPEGP